MTESEIRQGILQSRDTFAQCYWVRRVIRDLEDNVHETRAGDFIDVHADSRKINEEAQEQLVKLKEEILLENLPRTNIRTYEVGWSRGGIDPTSSDEHAQYVNQLCEDFERMAREQISQAIRVLDDTDLNDPLYEEAVQHLSFCRSKCDTFYGREEILGQCKSYLLSNSNLPYVIFGESGCGKTSIVSVAAKRARDWLGEQSNLIVRYLGTTPDSSQARLLLRSVCRHICALYRRDPARIRQVSNAKLC